MNKKLNNSLQDFLSEAIPLINQESERIWHKVNDVTVFEQRCFFLLTSTFTKLGSNIINRRTIINRTIKREAANCIKRNKAEFPTSLDFLAEKEVDRKKHNIQIKDVLADVESEVFAREKIANLAESDPRKMIVLNAWKDGCTNTTEIAGLLADKLGGSFEGHRSFIKRFRKECKLALAG